MVQTQVLDSEIEPGPYIPSEHQRDHSRPGLEGRIEIWHRWGDAGRLEIAGGFHSNRNHVDLISLPSNIYSIDWLFRPMERIEFSGMFFHGNNVDALGALRQGFTMPRTGNRFSVHSDGGWAQLRFPITLRLALDIYGGQQQDRNADLVSSDVSRNQAYFGNLIYRLAPNVLVSFEGGQIRTKYVGIGNRLNDHYDLALAYLF